MSLERRPPRGDARRMPTLTSTRKSRASVGLAVAQRPARATQPKVLLAEVRRLIHEARRETAQMVNAGLTLLYWQVGERVRRRC